MPPRAEAFRLARTAESGFQAFGQDEDVKWSKTAAHFFNIAQMAVVIKTPTLNMALQKAASDAIWQRTQAAKKELERIKKEEAEKASLSLLPVTLSVTPNQGLSASA